MGTLYRIVFVVDVRLHVLQFCDFVFLGHLLSIACLLFVVMPFRMYNWYTVRFFWICVLCILFYRLYSHLLHTKKYMKEDTIKSTTLRTVCLSEISSKLQIPYIPSPVFLAHLSTKCSVSFCDPSMSGVRRASVRPCVRQQFL